MGGAGREVLSQLEGTRGRSCHVSECCVLESLHYMGRGRGARGIMLCLFVLDILKRQNFSFNGFYYLFLIIELLVLYAIFRTSIITCPANLFT